MKRLPVLVNIAELPFSREHRRNQRLFEMLLDDGTLFSEGIYINPIDTPARPSLRHVRRFLWPARSDLHPSVTILAPSFVLPYTWRRRVAALEVALLAAQLRSVLAGRAFCAWLNNPGFHGHLLAMKLRSDAVKVIFDLSDDFTAFRDPDPTALQRRVQDLVEGADGVIAVNAHVAQKFPHPTSMVFRNGTDFDAMQRLVPNFQLGDVIPKPASRRYVGFVGGLHRGRLDEVLLERLLEAFPSVLFIFVGYSNDGNLLASLGLRPNVRVFPSVPYRELPNVIHAFDVAIIPHLDNELTRGNDLMKLRDYLACGVPVVATRSSGLGEYEDVVHVCDDHSTFLSALARLLDGQIRHDAAPGLAVARRESWASTVPVLIDWLRGIVGERLPAVPILDRRVR